jgi:hypothetical protein
MEPEYERTAAVNLQVGDQILWDGSHCEILEIKEGFRDERHLLLQGMVRQMPATVIWALPIFRVIPQRESRAVLQRALQNLIISYGGVASLYGFEDEEKTMEQLIDEALSELESEGQ